MNKRILLLIAATILGGHSAQPAKYLNEWQFDLDPAGRTLSQAINSGTDPAAFSADTNRVTRTDVPYLICSNSVRGIGNLWSDGAVLSADVTNQTNGVRFLRYDFEYDMTAANNDSGTLLGLGFTDSSGSHLTMVALEYAESGTILSPDLREIPVATTNLPLTGNIAVIAEVDLSGKSIKVWYDLSGKNNFSTRSNSPDATNTLSLNSIDQLQFRATGDFIASPSNDCVRINNIRTAATWAEIIAPVKVVQIVSVTDSLGGSMRVGETDTITVTIANICDTPTNVYSTLTHNGGGALSIISNNTPALLGPGDSTSNTYKVVANSAGSYTLQAQAFAEGASSSRVLFNLLSLPAQEISTNNLTITVAAGETTSATFKLVNKVQAGTAYSISDNATNAPWTSNSVVEIGDIVRTVAVHRITYTPENGTLGAYATQDVTIHVDAIGQNPGATNFTTTVRWGNGSTNSIAVTIIIVAANPLLTVTPAFIEFEGPAGSITRTNMIARNAGNVTLSYRVANLGALTNGYAWTIAPYDWETVYQQDSTRYAFAAGTDTGATPWIPLGFAFPFYGVACTQLSVSVDGKILLGDGQIVGPYQGDLIFDGNSDIRWAGDANHMAVTWERLAQRSGANDLTFQAILYKNGTILFQYALLSNSNKWPETDIGLKCSGYTSKASLIRTTGTADNPATVMYTTNYTTVMYTTNYIVVTNGWRGDFPITSTSTIVIATFNTNVWLGDFPIPSDIYETNVIATYSTTVQDQALLFYPAQPVVITCDPVSGTLAPGESGSITILGDARGLDPGGEAETTFDFSVQPPVLINLVSASDQFDWVEITGVYGLYQLRKKVGESYVPPFSGKPNAVYTGGVISQEQPFAPELGGNFLVSGNKWSWGPYTSGAWDTIYIRMPWVSDPLRDPDSRAEGFVQAESSIPVPVYFTATGSSPAYSLLDTDADGMADLAEWTAGTDANSASSLFAVASRQNPDGSRTLSWPAPNDPLSRTYIVWYTTSLISPWKPVVKLDNATSYIDNDPVRNAEPVIFYRVSIQ